MKATIGLTLKQFDELLSDFDRAYEKAMDADRSKRGAVSVKKGQGKIQGLQAKAQVVFRADLSEMLSHLMIGWGILFDLDSDNCCDLWNFNLECR